MMIKTEEEIRDEITKLENSTLGNNERLSVSNILYEHRRLSRIYCLRWVLGEREMKEQ